MSATSRRELLKAAGTVAAAAATASFSTSSLFAQPSYRIQVGAQTNAYPLDPKNFATVMDALAHLKAIGYQGFEMGYRNLMPQFAAPAEAAKKIDATGLTFIGIHIYLPHDQYDTFTLIAPASLYEQVAVGGAALGASFLICSGAAAQSAAQLSAKVAGLNAAAKFCVAHGIGFAYHNEEPESGSKLNELEVLYSQTDPTVMFLFDVGHYYNVGGDVVAFIRKHCDRMAGLHLRDYRDHKQVVLGTGTLPLAEIAKALNELQCSCWVEAEEERLDGVKHGDEYMKPAYAALSGAIYK